MARRRRIDYRPDDGDFALLIELAAEYQRLRDAGDLYGAALVALRMHTTAGHVADDAVLDLDRTAPRQRRALGREADISRGAMDNRVRRARERRDDEDSDQEEDG